MRCSVIVVAAGSGKRMGGSVPKQLRPLQGRSVLYYTLAAFQRASCVDEIVLVTAEDLIDFCYTELIEPFALDKVTKVIAGGKERYDSVRAGLAACGNTDLVMVHDGVRPFVTEDMLLRGIACAKQYGCAVAAVPAKDTVRIADADGRVIETPAREQVRNIQTPQIFYRAELLEAYERLKPEELQGITDDAMIMERSGMRASYLFEGDYRNLKLTTPEDLLIAEGILMETESDRKFIFLDVDGTLRDLNGQIPDTAVSAIRKARANGHFVLICSGRPYFQIGEEIRRIGFDGYITSSGGYIEFGGEKISETVFPEETLEALIRYLQNHDSMAEYHTSMNRFLLKEDRARYEQLEATLQKQFEGSTAESASMPELVDEPEDLKQVSKLLYYSKECTNEMIARDWPVLEITELSIPNSEPYGGEITPKGMTKAAGIREILQTVGRKDAITIAIGDGDNDLSMLQYASVGVAMGNGTEALKQVADLITSPLEADGIAEAFSKLGLI